MYESSPARTIIRHTLHHQLMHNRKGFTRDEQHRGISNQSMGTLTPMTHPHPLRIEISTFEGIQSERISWRRSDEVLMGAT